VDERYRILIVDDDRPIRAQLRRALSRDYDVAAAGGLEEARRAIERESPHLVALDISLSGPPGVSEEGFELLREIIRRDPTVKVVMITGSDDRERAERAIAAGAFDYFVKPFDIDELRVMIGRALLRQGIERGAAVEPGLEVKLGEIGGVFGRCPAMLDLFRAAAAAAPTDASVLITGEPGTEKMRLARAVHGLSRRRDKPFLTVPLRGVGDDVLAAELGITESGSAPSGLMARAEGGTIFFEDVHAISPRAQAVLLELLTSEKEIPAGEQPAGVRVVASSERELGADVRRGAYSKELFYRLAVVPLNVPSLRDRGEDIVLMARHLLEQYGREGRCCPVGFTRAAAEAMMKHDWPGNVQELESSVRRAAVLVPGRLVGASDLDLGLGIGRGRLSLSEARHELERNMVVDALTRSSGNISGAARAIGVSRPTFYDLVHKYGVDLAEFKEAAHRARDGGGDSHGQGRRDAKRNGEQASSE